MERQDSTKQQQLAREELLLRFIKAYEEGNLEVFSAILEQAKIDPELDTLIWDVFPTYLYEEEHISLQERDSLSSILRQTGASKSEASELSLADVAARMQVELTLHREMFTDPLTVQRALNTLVRSHDPLPSQLDQSIVQMIIFQHGLAVPPAFSNVFLRTARSLQEKRSAQEPKS
jgi:hypothetical protein